MLRRSMLLCVLCLHLAGCATLDVYRVEPASRHVAAGEATESGRCARLFAATDDAVTRWGVLDARATQVPGFPYLRSDRLLAALVQRADAGEQLNAWIRAAAAMDEDSRRHELAHLPDQAIAAIGGLSRDALLETLGRCRLQLAGEDLEDVAARARLGDAARVPDEYQAWKRALGLYPLTRLAFASGVRRWQAETQAVFNTPLAALPRQGRQVVYTPPPRRHSLGDLKRVFSEGSRNALGLYEWTGEERQALFELYAPRFVVDEATLDDRVGALEYDAGAQLWVNIFRPVVYQRLSHAWFGGRWLPQFVYSIWFPARTANPGIDLLAGRFDGLIWRVTVGTDGQPLVYDTIHPCGCYHLFFPTEALRARPQAQSIDETLFAPQSLPRVRAGESLALHIEAGTHYLRRVGWETGAAEARVYEAADDDELRSLRLPVTEPGGPQRRSAFGPDGILPGSERGERYLFWPMGVDNAGAMRQWGRHATAFVGERHFDDPDLFTKYFELR